MAIDDRKYRDGWAPGTMENRHVHPELACTLVRTKAERDEGNVGITSTEALCTEDGSALSLPDALPPPYCDVMSTGPYDFTSTGPYDFTSTGPYDIPSTGPHDVPSTTHSGTRESLGALDV